MLRRDRDISLRNDTRITIRTNGSQARAEPTPSHETSIARRRESVTLSTQKTQHRIGTEIAVPHESAHSLISFSSKDEPVANEVVRFLEADGVKCWISSRDVPAGANYQEAIVHAIELARAVIFLFSENSNASNEIKKELSLADRLNVPVIPLRLSPITPSGALRYELATRQWIDMFPDKETALRKLTETVRKNFGPPPSSEREPREADAAAPAPLAIAPRAPAATPSAPQGPILAPGSADFEAVRTALARHVGPIAKILIEKAAATVRTREELCEQLACNVKSTPDREAFLRTMRSRLGLR